MFPCVLAHFLHYHLLGRHTMTPKLYSLFSRLGRHSFRSFIRWILLLSGLSDYDLTHYHDQAVDKNNTEGHSPGANVNYINLYLFFFFFFIFIFFYFGEKNEKSCYDCLDLPRRSKTSKVKHRSAEDGKDQKIITRLPWFIDLR